MLNLSISTIQTLAEKNELQAWRTQGSHRRISMESIREYQLRHNIPFQQHDFHTGRHLRILLVEDDEITRKMLRDICDSVSMPVDCTAMSSGMEALVNIANIKPHLLITDLDMPGINGFELLYMLRQNPQFDRMAILALSALTNDEIQAHGGLPKASSDMQKPVRAEWLNGFFTGVMMHALDQQNTPNT